MQMCVMMVALLACVPLSKPISWGDGYTNPADTCYFFLKIAMQSHIFTSCIFKKKYSDCRKGFSIGMTVGRKKS